MGVHGLWQLLGSTGKPVPLESLEGKVLAVDVSVWLHQLSKGMRDSSGNPLPNAHLHGLFTRICKLLYYRIKPVFVFDGGVPTLKKQTLASRRNKREDAERTSSLMQQKILTNLIRSQALKEACGLDKLPELPQAQKCAAKGNKEALYQLPPLPEASKSYISEKSAEEQTDMDRWELQELVEEEYEDISKIDVESEDFKSLPSEVQHEIITDMRLRKKNYNLARIADLPDDSKDFSNYQMAKLVKHNKLNTRLEEIRKELNQRQTHSLTKKYGKRFEDTDDIFSQRVVSDDSSHYILAKRNLHRKREEEEKKQIKSQLEPVKEELEVIDDRDELLLDSDEDSCKEVDIMEESRLIVEEISGKSEELDKNGTQRSEITLKEQKSKERKEKACTIKGKTVVEDKPRFRAVIEVESDSGSEDSENSVEIVESKTHGVDIIGDGAVIIDDGTVDQDLQLAIEQSLKEQRHTENKKRSSNIAGDFVGRNANDSYECTSSSNEQGGSGISSNRRKVKSSNKAVQKNNENGSVLQLNALTGNSPAKTQISFKMADSSRSSKEQNSDYGRRVDSLDFVNDKLRAEIKNEDILPERKNSRSGLFKRKISCFSNESSDSDEASSKVKRVESPDIDSDRVKRVASQVIDSAIPDDIQDSESDSEGDFIEVKIDVTKVKEDELFPASMFETDADMDHKNDQEDIQMPDWKHNLDAAVKGETRNGTNFSRRTSGKDYEPSSQNAGERTLDTKISGEDEKSKQQQQAVIEIKEKAATDEVCGEQTESRAEDAITITTEEDDVTIATEDDVTIATEDHVTITTEADIRSLGSPEGREIIEDRRKKASSPPVTSLVRQFESLNEQHVKGLRENLASENRQLRLEQGRQERLAVSITDQMHAEAQELLQLFGIPYIVSPTEAEAQCAQLELLKLTNGTITDDSDIWLFGGKCVFKNFFNQQKHVECFKDVTISSQLGLSRESLINIALLCGSDYTEGIRGIGPVTAMEILAKFPGPGIEGLAKFKTWWEAAQREIKLPQKQSKFLAKLRDLNVHPGFPNTQVVEAYLSPTVDDSKEKFTWSLPDLQELRQFASSKLKWSREKMDEILLPVLKRLNEKQTQRSITAFFQPEIYMDPAPVKSKRLQKVLTKFMNPEGDQEDSENEEKTVTKKKTRSKGQKGQGDSQGDSQKEDEAVKKTKSKGQKKGQGITDVQEAISENIETDKQQVKRKSRASKRKDLESESDVKCGRSERIRSRNLEEVTDSLETEIIKSDDMVLDSERTKVGKTTKGRGRGRQRGQGRLSARSKSKVVETHVINSDSESSNDSDSDSSSSETDNEDDIDEDDEVAVIETGLNIDEILKLKMGCKLSDIKPEKETKKKEKVFENLINVNEILHLESGDNHTRADEVKKDSDESESFDDTSNDTVLDKQDKPRNKNITGELQSKDFSNEGGFIRDDEIEKSSLTTEMTEHSYKLPDDEISAVKTKSKNASDLKEDVVYIDGQENLKELNSDEVNESCKLGTKRTRSSRTNSKRDKTKMNKMVKNERKVGEIKEFDVVDNSHNDGMSTPSIKLPTIPKEETERLESKTVAIATVKPFRSTDTKESLDKTLKQEKSIYANDPINPVVSGLPWTERGKGRKRGQSGRGQGKVKLQKLTPVETFVKKAKPKESKKTFGCVNLSESDSDE